jgi:hypothetical protein
MSVKSTEMRVTGIDFDQAELHRLRREEGQQDNR